MAQIILDSNNNLIQGDFDNATLNNRTKLQTTTTNATTNVYIAPNGSSTSAGVSVANNSSLTNASKIVMATNGTTDTQIISGVNGSGTYLPLSFYTNNALAMQIGTNGYLGVGTSSPGAPLDVRFGTNPATDNGVGNNVLRVYTTVTQAADVGGAIGLGGYATTAPDSVSFAQIAGRKETSTSGNLRGYTQFATLDQGGTMTERMRLDSRGNLLVGTTSNEFGTLSVFNNSASFATNQSYAYFKGTQAGDLSIPGLFIVKFDNNTTTSQLLIRFGINNGTFGQGQINANGGGAAAFGSFSDARLKENIESLPPQLDNILALKPSEFDYKDGSGHQIGFIAQEMQEVYPDVVSVGENDMLTITGWSKTEARLVKAIQEQQTIINELKTRIEALESK